MLSAAQRAAAIARAAYLAKQAAKESAKKNGTASAAEIVGGASAASKAELELLNQLLRRQMEKPHVYDTKLKEAVEAMWRSNSSIGNGSTATALRMERVTGKPTIGSDGLPYFHYKKVPERIKNLNKIKNLLSQHSHSGAGKPELQPGCRICDQVISDIRNIDNMIADLIDAMNSPPEYFGF